MESKNKLEIKVWCGGKCAGMKSRILKDLPSNCDDRCPHCGYTLIKQNVKVSLRNHARFSRVGISKRNIKESA